MRSIVIASLVLIFELSFSQTAQNIARSGNTLQKNSLQVSGKNSTNERQPVDFNTPVPSRNSTPKKNPGKAKEMTPVNPNQPVKPNR